MYHKFSKTPIGKFRLIALLEGLSFLILLFIAMPLKYFAGLPLAVRVVGMVHGILFLLYVYFLTQVKFTYKWTFQKSSFAFLASLLPFGTFVLDSSLKKEELNYSKS